jgi:hypothetical protein
MWVFPDGFTGLFRPAAALPASLLIPVVPAPLPAVVPLVDPVAPPAAAPPVPELPPAPLPPACARAKVLVNASAMANPIVASFMIAPFLLRNGATRCARMRSCLSITVRCCSAEMTHWPQF